MRLPGLSLCLVACTLENPAFLVTDSGAIPTSGPTGPDTSSGATTSPDVTTGAVTAATTGAATTSEPGTGTTEPPSMSASSDPGETDTDAMACPDIDDALGPMVELISMPGEAPIANALCGEAQQVGFHGLFDPDPDGFTVKQSADCPADDGPLFQGLRVDIPLPFGVVGAGACVSLHFSVHPGYTDCVLSGFQVLHNDEYVLWGSFGDPLAAKDGPLEVGLAATGTCACLDCCPDGPDPDLYSFTIGAEEVAETGLLQVNTPDEKEYYFKNARSHVHAQECLREDLRRPDWLHFDWVAARVK